MLELFRSPRRAIVWFVEASVLSLLVVAVLAATLGGARAIGYEHVLRAIGISAVAQASIYYHGLYGPEPHRVRALAAGFVRALAAAAAALWILFHFVPRAAIGQGVIVAALGGAAVILPAWRAAYQRVATSDSFRRASLILGGGALARACAELVASRPELGLRLAGAWTREGEGPPGVPVLGRGTGLLRVCAQHGIGHIVVAQADRRGALPMDDLLELGLRGVEIESGAALYERATGRVFVRALRPSDLVLCPGYTRRGTGAVKRVIDVALAAALLVLSLPILLVAAIAVKLDSRGPVIYAQIRAGAQGSPFAMYKLRSMRADAEASGARWAVEDDPRVTRVGAFLRRARIDELPQLWNVLAGDMSLVGPRPERPVFVERIEREVPLFRQRLAVKPGLTGHAQVRCRYGASIEDAIDKLEYDLFYIKTRSIWFDLSILLDTVKVVLLRIGSR